MCERQKHTSRTGRDWRAPWAKKSPPPLFSEGNRVLAIVQVTVCLSEKCPRVFPLLLTRAYSPLHHSRFSDSHAIFYHHVPLLKTFAEINCIRFFDWADGWKNIIIINTRDFTPVYAQLNIFTNAFFSMSNV